MIDHWNGLELENTDFDYQHDRTPQLKPYHLQSQTLQFVEIINVQINTRFETSWEGS